jgi:hypothetical protein
MDERNRADQQFRDVTIRIEEKAQPQVFNEFRRTGRLEFA